MIINWARITKQSPWNNVGQSACAKLGKMKASLLYHPNSDHARMVEGYAADFERIKGHTIELISLETRQGADIARLYDIVRYPALIAARDNGELLKHWEGAELPLMDELAAYISS